MIALHTRTPRQGTKQMLRAVAEHAAERIAERRTAAQLFFERAVLPLSLVRGMQEVSR
ncbi:hypothetical protein [Paenibacillus sacheonensis]|uniref:Uncharacterized protein n=1 Tax=Paenibacillus sacheonensis TaxID=742054 RepID=A0A7X4YQR2_9BACL|nr:hypothetical protein [Paenibacillus sacheonensis]MBM7567369.1 hypothetical protein [Paenibacillus sacheonensis]NBC69849.1 hypothetical protein [Paenibacillus sacheonensis]